MPRARLPRRTRTRTSPYNQSEPIPGNGILQMLVAQVDLERAGAWKPAGWLGAFQFDEERRDLAPTLGGRNRNRIAHEPNVAIGIILRREGAAGFRPPQHTD